MPALPENNTARFFVDYENAVAGHTLLVRAISGITPAQIAADVLDILTIVGGLFIPSTVVRGRYSAAGSDFSFPVATTLDGYTFGTNDPSPERNATAATFVGRTPGGKRARFSIFGYREILSNYRLTSTENASVGSTVSALNANSRSFVAIDGNKAVWASYADIKASDYWVRRARG